MDADNSGETVSNNSADQEQQMEVKDNQAETEVTLEPEPEQQSQEKPKPNVEQFDKFLDDIEHEVQKTVFEEQVSLNFTKKT